MSITAEAPRGGVVEYIGDASYTFILRNREIERFEDKHRGIFDLWDGFFGRGKKPTSTEVRDIAALGLLDRAKLGCGQNKGTGHARILRLHIYISVALPG